MTINLIMKIAEKNFQLNIDIERSFIVKVSDVVICLILVVLIVFYAFYLHM